MLRSMTSFARAESKTREIHLIWEIKSVNHRFLETFFRIPDAFRPIEIKIKDLTRQRLKRGKVDGYLKIDSTRQTSKLRLNKEVLDNLLVSIQEIKTKIETAHINPLDILRWPGLIDDQMEQDNTINNLAIKIFEEALDDLCELRSREGGKLEQIIRSKLEQIQIIVSDIKKETRNILELQKEKLLDRIKELKVKVDDARIEQEIVMLLQKADVTEELDRLAIHVSEGMKIINNEGAHGRRLDFLSQELNRESNTLGAKAITSIQTQKAIDLKVLIEQIREQVQNIE